MKKEVSTTELHQKLGELLDGVYYNGDRLIIKRADTPLAAIVPIDAYQEILQQREQAFSVLDRIWEKVPGVSEEEAQDDIEQAIAEARAEKTRKRSKLPTHYGLAALTLVGDRVVFLHWEKGHKLSPVLPYFTTSSCFTQYNLYSKHQKLFWIDSCIL